MKPKLAWHVVALVLIASSVAAPTAAGQQADAGPAEAARAGKTGKPPGGNGQPEGKTEMPAEKPTLNYEELFGCKPMGEEGHTPPTGKGKERPDGQRVQPDGTP